MSYFSVIKNNLSRCALSPICAFLKSDPAFVEIVPLVPSLTSDLQTQMAEQFTDKKIHLKIAMNHDPGLMFFFFYLEIAQPFVVLVLM